MSPRSPSTSDQDRLFDPSISRPRIGGQSLRRVVSVYLSRFLNIERATVQVIKKHEANDNRVV
jgi:hypothetical protein